MVKPNSAMQSLAYFDRERLATWLRERGHKASHARAILLAFYQSDGRLDVGSLRGSRAVLAELRTEFTSLDSSILARHEAADATVKLLVGFAREGGAVEAVLMPTHRDGIAAGCVSAQIGC